MRKGIPFLFLGFLSLATFALGQEYPKATGYVNDFAHVLSQEQAEGLNTNLAELEKKTSVEVAVVTVSSLNGQDVESYTRGLATAWHVGKRGKNNGVVFLIAPNEHKMRIQTASGSRSVLTDSTADEIRDTFILPAFKRGDMAGGIVDGTHAIMRVFNEEPAGSRDTNAVSPRDDSSEPQPAPQAASQPDNSDQWTPEDTKILEFVGAGILAVVLLLIMIVPPIRRSRAKAYVIEKKVEFSGRLTKAESVGANPDVKDATHKKLSSIKRDFSSINQLSVSSDNADWIGSREKLDSLGDQLNEIVSTMNQEIAYAEKARKEGPKLMAKLPDMIATAEKQLAEGKESKKAVKQLAEAKEQYARAQNMQQSGGGMSMIDWIIIYELLSSSHANCESAQEAHTYVNTDHSSSYSSSSDSSSSLGFGDSSSGFGGGGGFDSGGSSGGFDSGGGGSSGSW